jgi:hypothetical protein
MELNTVQAQSLIVGVELHLPEIEPRLTVSREKTTRTVGKLVRTFSREMARGIAEKAPVLVLLHFDTGVSVE